VTGPDRGSFKAYFRELSRKGVGRTASGQHQGLKRYEVDVESASQGLGQSLRIKITSFVA
jgi:hypothetical protein